MGGDKDKKPDKAPALVDNHNDDLAPAAAPTPAAAEPLDFAQLDSAYEKAANAQEALMDRRSIGAREVLDDLNTPDQPSLADQLLTSLALAALGAASGGVTTVLAGKILSTTASQAIQTAVQSGLDDGLKDAAVKIAQSLGSASDSTSRTAFFAGQQEGIVVLKQASVDKISDQKLSAKTRVKGAAQDKQADAMATEIKGAEDFRKGANQTAESGRSIQYRESLAKWMNAISRSKLGTDKGSGATDLGGDVGSRSPDDHFRHAGAGGVIYVQFAMHPANKPFKVTGNRIKVAGMTEAVRDRLKSVAIKDLGIPIVASGYIYDGTLDGLYISNNEIAFGKNEGGTTWVTGHDNAMEGLKKAAGKSTAADAAADVIETDIGTATLDGAIMGG
jgi:hypothetical protein